VTNFIPDRNPFNLQEPPEWWLKCLYDFDQDLVIVPSRMERLYRLARRARKSPGIGPLAILDRQADTAMLASYRLIPVTSIISWGVWGTHIFNELRARDLWRAGGATKYIQTLEAFEAEQERKRKEAIAEGADYRARDAWRSYQARTGQRLMNPGLTSTPGAHTTTKSAHSSGSTAGRA
jgi:hypothetical protein